MPHKKKPRRYITPLVLFTLAGWALWALGRNEPTAETPDAETTDSPRATGSTTPPARTRAPWSKRRLATSLAFATLFFGGAAFSAGAGDVVANALEGDTATEATSTGGGSRRTIPQPARRMQTAARKARARRGRAARRGRRPRRGRREATTTASPETRPSLPPMTARIPATAARTPATAARAPATTATPETVRLRLRSRTSRGRGQRRARQSGTDPGVGDGPGEGSAVERSSGHRQGDAEPGLPGSGGGAPTSFFATIWLHRPLPDPTPPAKRLKQGFADALARVAWQAKVDWALVLGVLRARGFDSSSMSLDPVRERPDGSPISVTAVGRRWACAAGLRRRAVRQGGYRASQLQPRGRPPLPRGGVRGGSKPRLQRMMLRDKRMSIYAGGRLDIALGRTDVRVLVAPRATWRRHTVRSPSRASRPATGSTPGRAWSRRTSTASPSTWRRSTTRPSTAISGLAGSRSVPCATSCCSRPSCRRSRSSRCFGLGGPSFPLANHDDHIHVGY